MNLLKEAEGVIAEMRQLAAQDFSEQLNFIAKTLKAIEDDIRIMAELPLGFDGDNICPVCGEAMRSISEQSKACLHCMGFLVDNRVLLSSEYGFCTSFI